MLTPDSMLESCLGLLAVGFKYYEINIFITYF